VNFRTVLFAALLFPAALFAENGSRPTSFVGVPWGSKPEDAVRILAARTGVAAPEELTVVDKLELKGGKFAGQSATGWTLEFADRKLYAAAVQLKPESTAASLYRELKQMLIAKYGPVSGERKPDAGDDADKKLKRDRRRQNPDTKTFGSVAFWKFPPTLGDKERKLIELELASPDGSEALDESQLVVTIRYLNESLKPLAAQPAASAYKSEPSRPAVKVDDL
jgi:hypothetical protein